MCSRILGLVREQIFAAMFDRALRDCFLVAFRLPNLLRDLFAEGALSTAFVTVFSQKMKTEGDRAAWQLAHRTISLATVVMSGITLLGMLCAPWIVRAMAGSWEPWKVEFTILLTRIMFPFILLVSLAALVMGILNSRKVYGAPAMASSYFNIVSILGGAGLAWLLDPHLGPRAMIGFSIGTLLGGLAQLGVQLPALFREGYRFRFSRDWKDPGVKRIQELMWPAVIAGSAVQVNVLMNTMFATELAVKNGPVSWLSCAFRLMQLPLGVFGVTVATLTLPVLSRAATSGVTDEFRTVLGSGNRLVLFLTLPSAVGLFVLAQPIISVLYEHGMFTAYDTAESALALRWYAVGLIFYACIKVIQPAFTAIGHRFVPMAVALGSILLNAGLNSMFVYHFRLGHEFLALSTAVIAAVNFLLLYYFMRRITGGLDTGRLLLTLLKLLPGTVALGFVSWAGLHWGLTEWATSGLPRRAVSLGLIIAAAGSAYFVLALALKVDEAGQFFSILQKRRARRGKPRG
ncbi:MAG: murein biosynthesis integral membrane protein MurJ [Verrucomicrobiaceae bacterium]|nr:MAG: murein biosynthesis integral membrane protein MurJ [Verrucomicrobiaceae bacterium]